VTDLVSLLLAAITAKEEKATAAKALHVSVTMPRRNGKETLYAFLNDNDPSSALRRCTADRGIVEWCIEVAGDLDLSRYGEPGLLKDHPQSLAVTLAAETLLNLARGYGLDVAG
jgi:hypothetical protein